MAQKSAICDIVHHARRSRACCQTMVSSFKTLIRDSLLTRDVNRAAYTAARGHRVTF